MPKPKDGAALFEIMRKMEPDGKDTGAGERRADACAPVRHPVDFSDAVAVGLAVDLPVRAEHAHLHLGGPAPVLSGAYIRV